MSQSILSTIEINPKSKPKASVIWLHGLGASGHDFSDIVPQLQLPDHLSVRFIFPHAPHRPVTLNRGFVMPAWFDIIDLAHDAPQDEEGIKAAALQIRELITVELSKGIPANKIILAGFSQGGALALYAALSYPQRLAGVMALSTFIPIAHTLASEMTPANQNIPIFMAHGDSDALIPPQWGEWSRDHLLALNYSVEWHLYPMEHSVCLEEVHDISKWLEKILT